MNRGDEYTCAYCKEIFLAGWSDEEAKEELKEDFPDEYDEPLEVLCDDCYKEFNKWYGTQEVVP